MPTNKIMDADSYESKLVNWERTIGNFMIWLKDVCDVDDGLYNKVDSVVKNDKDLRLWISFFDGDFDNVEATTDLYIASRK